MKNGLTSTELGLPLEGNSILSVTHDDFSLNVQCKLKITTLNRC